MLAALAVVAPALAAGAKPVAPNSPGVMPLAKVGAWVSPTVDVPALLREDAANAGKDQPLRIGYPMRTDLSPANAGSWEPVKNGRLWRLSVRSDGALWVVLGFDTFRVPAGASLTIYDPSLKTVLSYGAADVRGHGELWTPPVEGDALVVELFMPAALKDADPQLHLGTISHGYKPFGSIGRSLAKKDTIGESGACNIDVNCPLGTNWQNEKRGVVILLSGGSGFCSGSLINTTANDCRPYVLTAHHCTAGTSTTFGFNYERSGCGTGDPGPPDTYTVTGATVLADYATSDFTLLQMSAAPPEAFNVYYNGWYNENIPSQQSWVIHHPEGDVKKISHDVDPPTDGTHYNADHWRIGQYEEGTTEPGSSGSPLFDQNHHITGQLHGGTASCTSITYDEYGKVSASWIGGGTTASRLSDWLDPNGTGQTAMDGVNAATCAFHPAGEVHLDRSKYACTDTMVITLRDDNLRGNATQDVTVTSNTETTPETVTLTAVEAGSGTFTGTFPVGAPPAVHGDGKLSVNDGDTVTVTYIDADDGSGGTNVPVTTTGAIDCRGPVISAVGSQNVTGNSAEVVWTTDELSNSRVVYDTAFPPSAGNATSAVITVSHLVKLTGLNPCTTYYFYVSSTDTAGNIASDTNNGQYYTFRTGTNTNPTYLYAGVPVPIPDNNAAGATAVISVPYFDFIQSLTVSVDITHTYDGDIALSLIAPDGTTIPLSTKRGGSGDNYVATVFDDAATTPIASGAPPFTGSFKPESPLAVLAGKTSYGDWTLKVVDNASSDTGTITGWSITFLFPPAPCGAQVILDKDTYGCSTTAHVTVKDTNVAGATITVNAKSNTEPGGQSVTLTRQPAPKDTWFEGDVTLTPGPVSSGDGLVSVVNGDLLTVTYIDADDGLGNTNVPVTDTANTDCNGPVISNVSSSNVQGTQATINWTTSKPANSLVRYGLAVPPTLTSSDTSLVTTHALPLSGLNPCSTYYYQVESTDAYGNVAVDNNGGNYYLFTTPQNTAATYTSTDGPIAIPDNSTTGAISTINVADADQILDLNVVVNITHTFTGDLTLSLIAPNGTTITLSARHGSSGDNYTNTVFDDAATTPIASGTAPFTGSFKPDSPLAAINGLAAAGAWQLKVVDSANSDTGSIQNWSLQFTYQPRVCGPSAKYLSNTITDQCPVGGAGNGNGAVEQGENITMPVTIRNDGAVNLTQVVGTLTTTNPDVYITTATAAFPDVASGLTAGSLAPHFTYTLGQALPCGTDIPFNLAIHTAQGTFNSSFVVKVGAIGSATTPYVATDVPKPIPDNNATGVSSTLAVADTGTITKVRVMVNITHTWDNDVSIYLIAPNGTTVTLSARHGSSGDNYTNTWFDDAATTPIASGTPPYTGTYKPDSALGVLNNLPANGTWTLKVTDSASSDTGTLTGWTLELTTQSGYTCTACAVAGPTVEVVNQNWVGRTGQTWDAVAGASAYKLYRGVGGDLPALVTPAPDSCLRLTVGTNATGPVLSEQPSAGNAYWYLVRAVNGGGEGPAGNATSGPRQQNSTGSCP